MSLGDIVDQLHDDDGFSDAGSAEGTHFAALGERADQVDDLDAGFQDLSLGVLLQKRRGFAVDGIFFLVRHGAASIGRLACDIEDTSKNAFADGDRDWSAESGYFHAA